ncbi:hypothetical protein SteCoe_7665 [Stentor coeruleus]|uniref:Guanylate kinase-like domain-containing protein n=1 Tax=Stentor coeruleus TaxID=5963 RepID=A0A1R2CMB1_9CILI|nr:hypothetical protein SteCoe_7665 [Stentor coeruleus]
MSGVDLRNVSLDALQAEVKRRFECSFKPRSRVVLVGPAGSGKGTQAPRLSDEMCWCHLSTGDLLRDEVKKGSELGREAKKIMDAGGLVSDDIVIGMIKNKISEPMCSNGVIFDGFPRTVNQAKALDNMLASDGKQIDKAIEFDIPDQVLVERITGRRIHLASGRSYHIKFAPPKVEGIDDITGEPLIHRTDDTEEALMKRMNSYHANTGPILDYYKQKGRFAKVDANRNVDDVWNDLKNAARPI